jgi:hypothetical protein
MRKKNRMTRGSERVHFDHCGSGRQEGRGNPALIGEFWEDITLDSKTLLVGGAALLAVAVVWTQTRDSKPKTDPRVAELETQISDLTAQLGEMQDSMAGMAERADAQADAIAQSAELGSRLAKTVQGLGSISSAGGSEQAASGGAAPSATGATQQAASASGSEGEPQGLGAGETAILAEGAIRAFVSRVDDAAQSVRVLVNGSMETLGSAAPVKVSVDGQDCAVKLDGIDRGKVALSAECGSAAGSAGGDAAAPAGEAAAAPSETTEGGVAPGNVASFADGSVRIFVSWIAEDGSAARIAVNGTDQTTLAVGESTEVDGCNVSLTGISSGRASLGYGCSS